MNDSPRAERPLEACPIEEQYGGVDGPSQNKGDWKSPREKVGGGCLYRAGMMGLEIRGQSGEN